VPLEIFKFRNFSLGNICIMAMGFTVAGTPLPIMLYFQQAHGMNAMEAGFMMVPQALMAAVLSPFVGKLVDRSNPGLMAALGFSTVAVSIVLLSMVMIFDTGLVWALVSMTLLGIGNAFVWAPNSTSTMRDLPHKFMGAGSGVFNTTRQLGSVIGAAAIGAVMQIRLAAGDEGAAFGQALLLAAAVLVIGIVASTMAGKNAHPAPVKP
ncbi:MAG: MFS transporter, partial [Corynebacterium glutamicum]|nr:MFS transporter [Corynebacterium glutamicum]